MPCEKELQELAMALRRGSRYFKGSWVHAYLHRKEGDQDNAAYWYSRAGKPVCREPLDAEWLSIVGALL
jgi:predicted transcriptional regulator